jgi:hypothetical protein
MITPSTRASIRPRFLSTSAIPQTQARSLFGWSDPVYPRSIRHREIKIRAKLLRTLRRRQQYDWDVAAKPYLSTKHVRYASHWDGTNRQRRGKNNENDDEQPKRDTISEGHELSEREKAWKQQMETMRKRVEADPYEAVFGKRFEPFWTPLLPQWMKDDLGLSKKESEKSPEPIDVNSRREKNIAPGQPTRETRKRPIPNTEQQASRTAEPYSYASSTSWDSQTNKTKRSEWDSVSRKTSNFEYDPVSNRMVPLEPLRPTNTSQAKVDVPSHFTWKPIVARAESASESSRTRSDKATTSRPIGAVTFSRKASEPAAKADSPPASSRPQNGELDALSANDIRAHMGKTRRTSAEQQDEQQGLKQHTRDWDNSVTRLKDQVSAIVDEVSAVELGRYLPTTMDRRAQTSKPTQAVRPMQPALQRMQTKAEPEPTDLDDSAAHESTEPISKPVFMPRDWNKQADILQSERVMRTTGSYPQPTTRPTMRWLDDMNARKAEYQTKEAAADAEKTANDADKNAALEKANAMLQAEVAAQKLAMSEHQDRTSNKIRSLRGELETAYKQSSVHADAFRDRIASLEKELSAAQNTKNEVQVKAIKERYSDKVRGLQKELERAYKQSSVHADEFTKRIKTLESELVGLTQAAGGASDAKSVSKESKMREMQGEGDFCPNVVKFAGSDMWYKQPSSPPQPSVKEMATIEQAARDKKLVTEVKSIDELMSAYQHQRRHPQRAALDAALVKHDKNSNYAFKKDGLEAELSGKSTVAANDASAKGNFNYGYKRDNLEADLAKKTSADASNPTEQEYKFKRDNLEAELTKKASTAGKSSSEQEYKFKSDNLEAELAKKTSTDVKDLSGREYKFKRDNLEAELAPKSSTDAKDGSKREYKFKRDNLEADLAKKTASNVKDLSDREYAFKDDSLESYLRDRDQGSKSAVKQRYEKFFNDGLGEELKNKGKSFAPAERSTRFKPDGLEAELRRLAIEKPAQPSDEYEAAVARATSPADRIGIMEQAMASSLGSELDLPTRPVTAAASSPSDRISKKEQMMASSLGSDLDMPTRSVTSAVAAATGVQWQQPPLYKVVAYDSGNDRFSTATTTSWDASVDERPISIPQALSQLYQPARWTKHFATLQREGYQVVHAREDVLVLKKVKDAGNAAEASPKAVSHESQPPVNPVDGTSRSIKDIRPVTGDYANPTGYVNLDPIDEPASKSAERSSATAAADFDTEHPDLAWIMRQEPVFSGTRRVNNANNKNSRRARREARDDAHEAPRDRKPRSLLLWTLGVGATTSFVMYVSGSVAEKARLARLEREARAPVLETRGAEAGRWRLDEGVWKREG